MDLMTRARSGDAEAFRQLVTPHERELKVHCYRILGSVQDAEDALQETLLAAWRGLPGFEGRSSIRTWLYQVATSRCLNALRTAGRRPRVDWPPPGLQPPEPNRMVEVAWLEPYPDVLLAGRPDTQPGPEARYEATEAISLAFIAALQFLPPRQRAVLILRDVLGFRAAEVASMLGSTQESVTSALKRARAALQHRTTRDNPPLAGSAHEQELAERFARAYEAGDVDGVVALLTDDVTLAMPPVPLEYQGRAAAGVFLTTVRRGRTFRLIATRANGQPAFGLYLADPRAGVAHAHGLLVLTITAAGIDVVTRFDASLLGHFGLPRLLPA